MELHQYDLREIKLRLLVFKSWPLWVCLHVAVHILASNVVDTQEEKPAQFLPAMSVDFTELFSTLPTGVNKSSFSKIFLLSDNGNQTIYDQ